MKQYTDIDMALMHQARQNTHDRLYAEFKRLDAIRAKMSYGTLFPPENPEMFQAWEEARHQWRLVNLELDRVSAEFQNNLGWLLGSQYEIDRRNSPGIS